MDAATAEAFIAGAVAGATVALVVARRRGHVRMSLEVGDPPTRDRDTPPE